MASTNKTSHYNLSQYVANDKPTYLVDYNSDMSNIDAGIYSAESKATINEGAIGDLTTLNTTNKTDLVSAVNEVKGDVDTNTNNISTNTSNISTLGTNQGVMANLTTTEKSSLVGAINEVDAVNDTQNTKISNLEDMLKFTDIDDCTVTITGAGSPLIDSQNIKCAKNSDGSIFKIYGNFVAVMNSWESYTITITGTGLPSVDNDYNILGGAMAYVSEGSIRVRSLTYKTNGVIQINISAGNSTTWSFYLPPCLYINSNFGDTPINN